MTLINRTPRRRNRRTGPTLQPEAGTLARREIAVITRIASVQTIPGAGNVNSPGIGNGHRLIKVQRHRPVTDRGAAVIGNGIVIQNKSAAPAIHIAGGTSQTATARTAG